jgi:hypothetical protein
VTPPDYGAGEPQSGPTFLEQADYRRRRLVDAVRLLPLLGAGLWAVPLLWAPGAVGSSVALLYVFGVWLMLVIAAAVLAQAFRKRGVQSDSAPPEESATPPQPDGRDGA